VCVCGWVCGGEEAGALQVHCCYIWPYNLERQKGFLKKSGDLYAYVFHLDEFKVEV
jgi:hypothetical protein